MFSPRALVSRDGGGDGEILREGGRESDKDKHAMEGGTEGEREREGKRGKGLMEGEGRLGNATRRNGIGLAEGRRQKGRGAGDASPLKGRGDVTQVLIDSAAANCNRQSEKICHVPEA